MTTAQLSTLAPRARRKMRAPEPPDAVTQYALDVLAGRIVAGKHVRLACERHISDLATGHERGLAWDAKEAERSIDFYHLLHHYKGREDLIVLDPWQKFIVGSAFGWKRADGSRRFRIVYVEVASKNGKSTMAGGAGLRLAFFDNEPGAEVYAAATKRDQAKIPWLAAVAMVKKSPSFRAVIETFVGSLAQASTSSFFQPLGRDSDSDQGINPNGAIIDELHVHDNRDLLDNIEKAASVRRQPMIWKITTAGVRRESVWWEERSDALAVLEGRATDDSLFAVIYTLDEGDDPFDEAVWPKANPGLGSSVQLDFLRERSAKAQRSPGALAAYLRFHMNIPTAVATRAIDIREWDAGNAEPVMPAGVTVYDGLDLASVRDLTALIVVHRDDEGFYNVLCRFWCPEQGIELRSRVDGVPYADWVRDGYLIATPGNVTDYDFVQEEAKTLAEQFTVGEIAYDRWNASQLVTNLQSDGATMIAISQTHAGLATGWRELEKAILEHKVRHGGNPILRWMAGNVEVETDAAGNQKPSKAHSTERIDGMVGLTMAVGRWVANGEVAVWTAA
jgi:phage terminase large subunit-like protein